MIDYTIIAGYLLLTLFVGIYKGRVSQDMRDFSVASRSYATPVLVATIFATWVGGEATLGMADKVFSHGIVFIIIFFGSFLNKMLIAQIIAPRMDRFVGMISVGDIMGSFYGKSAQMITGIGATLASVVTLGAQISAMGYLFHFFLGMPHTLGVLIGCGIVIFYTSFGGIRAVTATDVVQFIVLIITIPMICNAGLNKVGGYTALWKALPEEHLSLFPGNQTSFHYISLFLVFAIPFLNPAITQRLLMAKDSKQIRDSMSIAALVEIPFYLAVGCIGLVALVLNPGIEPQLALPYLIKTMLPVGLKGLTIAGMLAVIMSTADSFLNSAGIALVHDVIKPLGFQNMSDRKEVLLARIATFFLGVSAIVAALSFKSTFDIIMNSFNYWSPFIIVPLYAGIFNVRASQKAFFAGIVASLMTLILWPLFLEPYINVTSLIPSMLANALGFFLVHHFRKGKNNLIACLPPSRIQKKAFTKFILSRLLRICLRYIPSIANLRHFSESRVRRYGAHYVLFSIFTLLNYVFPYYMWSPARAEHPFSLLVLKYFAGILCALLLLKDFWPQSLQRYLPLYWHITLLFCLPFLTTYMLLENQASLFWMVNMALALLFLVILVDWLSFVLILGIGTALGVGVFVAVEGIPAMDLSYQEAFIFAYMCIFATLIGLIFSRRKSFDEEEKQMALKAIAGSIAHEMRTPLATLSESAKALKKTLPALIESSEMAQAAKLPTPFLAPWQYEHLKQLSQDQQDITNDALDVIDVLLVKLKDSTVQADTQHFSIQQCVQAALAAYPFKEEEKHYVQWEKADDFCIEGNLLLMKHVLFNLLKNALTHIGESPKKAIIIRTESSGGTNTLYIKDTGCGIAKNKLPYVFDRFYTRSKGGTGIGLAFCKLVVEAFGGMMSCHSLEGEYTEFSLSFPSV